MQRMMENSWQIASETNHKRLIILPMKKAVASHSSPKACGVINQSFVFP